MLCALAHVYFTYHIWAGEWAERTTIRGAKTLGERHDIDGGDDDDGGVELPFVRSALCLVWYEMACGVFELVCASDGIGILPIYQLVNNAVGWLENGCNCLIWVRKCYCTE